MAIMKIETAKLSRNWQRLANSIARKHGYGRADYIILGEKNRVVNNVSSGYRKYSTGEYVPKSYLNNFGWKNTYYQKAQTTVEIAI